MSRNVKGNSSQEHNHGWPDTVPTAERVVPCCLATAAGVVLDPEAFRGPTFTVPDQPRREAAGHQLAAAKSIKELRKRQREQRAVQDQALAAGLPPGAAALAASIGELRPRLRLTLFRGRRLKESHSNCVPRFSTLVTLVWFGSRAGVAEMGGEAHKRAERVPAPTDVCVVAAGGLPTSGLRPRTASGATPLASPALGGARLGTPGGRRAAAATPTTLSGMSEAAQRLAKQVKAQQLGVGVGGAVRTRVSTGGPLGLQHVVTGERDRALRASYAGLGTGGRATPAATAARGVGGAGAGGRTPSLAKPAAAAAGKAPAADAAVAAAAGAGKSITDDLLQF